jgi:hypothetical protein
MLTNLLFKNEFVNIFQLNAFMWAAELSYLKQ